MNSGIGTGNDHNSDDRNTHDGDNGGSGDSGSQTDSLKNNDKNSGVTSFPPFFGVVVMFVFRVLLH